MSDIPPPPPPHLTPPPGYTPYPATPATIGRLSRVGGLAKVLVVLVAVLGVATFVSALIQGLARDDARAYLAGELGEDEFLEAYLPSAGLTILTSTVQLAVVVLTMVLWYRLAANLRSLGRTTTWGPGWAIGGWFLPPLVLYVIPYLMTRELWKASDPDVALGDDSWRGGSVNPIVTVWWVLFGLVPLALLLVQGASAVNSGLAAGSTEALAELLDEQYAVTVIGGAVSMLAALAFAATVSKLSDRHRRLTGESATI